jgi:methyltransferase (TIGR00027 family)
MISIIGGAEFVQEARLLKCRIPPAFLPGWENDSMSERDSSTTALRVAQLRAVHMLADGEPKILNDPVVVRLFGDEVQAHLASDASTINVPWIRGLRSHVLLRSRFAEDRLAEAVKRGVRQYVVLGAGYDTFAYRQPGWARGLRVFEVDHPASQRAKRERLQRAGVAPPDNLEFVAIDFEHVSLGDGLGASALDFSRPAFFACLGVLVYLSQQAAEAIFRLIAAFPESSEIVFTYSVSSPSLKPEEARRREVLSSMVESMGEPWRTHFEFDVLEGELKKLGFKVVLLTAEDAQERYFQGRSDGLHAPNREPLVSAIVGRKE